MEHKKCIVSNCNGNAASRGLCYGDYYKALRLVNKKETTWDFLIKHNLALYSNHGGKPSDFMKKFKEAKAGLK